MRTSISLALAALVAVAADGPPPSLRVSGGLTLAGGVQPLFFTWSNSLPVTGAGFGPGEQVEILLHGPLDSPGVAPRIQRGVTVRVLSPGVGRGPLPGGPTPLQDLAIGLVTADAQGNFTASPKIPSGAANFARPGYYEVRAAGRVTGTVASPDHINVCPDTYTGANPAFDWGHDRGGRDGVVPDPLRQFSPERFDPEWPATWDARPVEVYGTIAATDGTGADEAAKISPSDNPPTHYAHDSIFFLNPDAPYRWLVGTANFYNSDVAAETGRLEVEWETQNGGSTSTYDQGNIGVPVWAHPSVGDRVYAVGRWILDAGHPELGDRTEIHPPRLLATMRQRPDVINGAAAAQVDIYASGHGGGANWMPPGLTTLLDRGGYGGGRIPDVLSASDQDKYYRPGPLTPLLLPLVLQVVKQITGVTITTNIFSDAGPSAFPWGTPGTEERPINDMDYAFDVPLPPRPAGATSVIMTVTTRPEHTTQVVEEVTFTSDTAHIRLPYRGADNGIYARTLRFAWNQAVAPASHIVVRLNRIDVNDSAGKWQMWADVSGRWSYLSGAAPGLLSTTAGKSVTLPGTPVDVYLNAGQTLRVYVQGYSAACLDDFFGQLFKQSSYVAGLGFVATCGASDNLDLGGALLELPATPSPKGTYTVQAVDRTGAHHFAVAVTVDSQ